MLQVTWVYGTCNWWELRRPHFCGDRMKLEDVLRNPWLRRGDSLLGWRGVVHLCLADFLCHTSEMVQGFSAYLRYVSYGVFHHPNFRSLRLSFWLMPARTQFIPHTHIFCAPCCPGCKTPTPAWTLALPVRQHFAALSLQVQHVIPFPWNRRILAVGLIFQIRQS